MGILPEYYDFSTQDERYHGLIRCTSRASYHYSPASSGKKSSHMPHPVLSSVLAKLQMPAVKGTRPMRVETSEALEAFVRRNGRGK